MERYIKNKTSLSESEQSKLADCRVFVVGCGGLGGYIIELLARVGVGHLTVLDGDVFVESNLNRQLFCTAVTIGTPKAIAAVERLYRVNPLVSCEAVVEFLTERNADSLSAGHDIVVDALDSVDSRSLLLGACEKASIPLVHGAIAGWRGRVSVIYPGDAAAFLCSGNTNDDKSRVNISDRGMEQPMGNLGFTAACIASIQVAETIKSLLSKGRLCRNKTIEIDLLTGTTESVELE